MNTPRRDLHIFRAGRHTATDGRSYEFSEQAIAELADSYDPSLHDAPLVVGHPRTDDPAYGWTASLRNDGGDLYAEPRDVDVNFAEMVNAKRFKNISASIFLPDSPGNPTPGKHYLRHIGFLGAKPPAVKGLRSAQFSDADDGAVEFAAPISGLGYSLTDLFQRLRDYFVDREGIEDADRIIPQWQIRAIDEHTRRDDSTEAAFADGVGGGIDTDTPTQKRETDMTEPNAEFAEREQALTQRKAEQDQREQRLREREDKARRDDAAHFADGLVEAGQLLPRQRNAVVELLLAVPADTSISFAEADGADPAEHNASDTLRGLLSALPKHIDFSEKSGAGDAPAVAEFAAPAGAVVDTGAAELYAAAKRYQKANPGTDWLTAVGSVSQ